MKLVSSLITGAAVIPGGHWWTAGAGPPWVAIFYLLLLLLTMVPRQHRVRGLLLLWSGWFLCGWLFFQATGHDREGHRDGVTTCTFLDMGHGASVLLQFPNGKTMLYDAGSMSSARFAADQVSSAVWSEQVEHLDAIIISHPDLDHFNAVPELIRRFSVGTVFLGQPEFGRCHGRFQYLMQTLHAAGVPVRYLAWNDEAIIEPDLKLSVLMPPDAGVGDVDNAASDNANSVVLVLETDWHKLVLPGDLEGRGMQLLLRQPTIDCDVALMPHHGSRLSLPKEFIQWCRPEYAVISAGRNRTEYELQQQLRDMGCQPMITGGTGSIRFQFQHDQIAVSAWDGRQWQARK